MIDQLVILNNKKSKKVGYKRRDALQIAQQIKQFLADRGVLLPHSSDRLFGRGFKPTMSMKTKVSNQVHNEYNLEEDLDHMARYHKYLQRAWRKIQFIPGADFVPVPFYFKGGYYRGGFLPKTFRQFTQYAYLKIKKEKIREIRREYDGLCEEKTLRSFVDRETGELLFDDYNQLARAYYALYQCSPATYAIFKHPTHNAFSSQGITFTCSKHRIDPVWNYVKSKKLRSAVHSWMASERIHERFQPMHLVLTVPHPDGKWMGKNFYAREMVERFNILRKNKLWKRYIYGGLQCLEITRKGKNGLHIHIHAMVLQNPAYTRNEVAEFIQTEWAKATGGVKCWYETLYIHRRVNDQDKKSPWICETDENGNKVWDDERQEFKKKKFYLSSDSLWFRELPPEDQFKQYVNGVLECIKYHFKYESFKTGRKVEGTNIDEWDIQLIADVLKHSKNLRMFDKFGALHGEKRLSMANIEKQAAADTEKMTAALPPTSDGVEDLVTNPYTGLPAQKGEYTRVLAMPQFVAHAGPQSSYRPLVDPKNHDVYFEIRPDIPIKRVIEAIMKKTWQDILREEDYHRLRECNYRWCAPRETLKLLPLDVALENLTS